jgi:hypothetical protein
MRGSYPWQHIQAGNGIANGGKQKYAQAVQLHPFVRRRSATTRADRSLWQDLQSAMLAVHGHLASFPEDSTAKRTKPI